MRFIYIALFTALTALPLFWGTTANANPDRCTKAESTADDMACANDRHQSAQARLKNAFDGMLNEHVNDQEGTDVLWQIQKGWLAYRDQECERQVENEETESLKRIKELNCLADLTRQRANILELSLHEDLKKDDIPAWMNTASSASPKTMWDYGTRLQGDTNCDDAQDWIMVGLSPNEKQQKWNTTIGIITPVKTGKPNIKLINLASEDTEKTCLQTPQIKIEKSAPVTDEKNAPSCPHVIQVKSFDCVDYNLNWDGKRYSIINNTNAGEDQ